MARKALIVGVNYYEFINPLNGCVSDAYNVKSVLEKHGDGTKNFDIKICVAMDEDSKLTRMDLKESIKQLFKDDDEVALFYFSGHGHIENTGGYILTSECTTGDDGLPMNDILKIVNDSKAINKIVILDTCHSGKMGNFGESATALINQGVTILSASQQDEYSMDEGDGSTFTKLFVDALDGSAANLIGEITPGSVYAHIDQSLGAWEQRPVFKTNVKSFVSLRKVPPSISMEDLKKITELFDESFEHNLNPSYEPDSEEHDQKNMDKFKILQKYNRVNLVVPVGAEHMYYAAMESKKCKLTVLGEFYWNLVKKGQI